MNLNDFHAEFRNHVLGVVAERTANPDESFPSEELIYAELVMENLASAGICEGASTCHWTGTFGQSKLRISGFSVSDDESRVDLFVTCYFGSDTLTQLPDADIRNTAKQAVNFAINSARGKLLDKLDPTSPVIELVELLQNRWRELDQLRIIVITDGQTKSKHLKPQELEGRIIQVEAMDIERLLRHSTGRPRDEIVISFEQSLGHALPCVYVPDAENDYEYALAAIPGEVIRALYERYNTMLLEANVRSFLGGRGKVNKGIAQTLAEEPGHFMAFNNGLVLVCDEARLSRREDGLVGLSLLKGLQIVNGGQTTSSIYFASRDNKAIDLSAVMVPAKIIVLKSSDETGREKLISNISKFANSQNAVKTSDLSANRPFHVQLEKLSNDTWCPNGVGRWFYERAAGSYAVMLLREGRTPAQRKRIIAMVPSRRKLTKNDIAKYHESWRGLPGQVALGGEKNFAQFMAHLDEDPSIVPNPLNPTWFKELIAKIIVFKEIEAMIKRKEAKVIFRQGYVNIATYTVALISHRLGERIDFLQIWQRQTVTAEFSKLLWDWAVAVNGIFEQTADGRQFSEVAKRPELWAAVRDRFSEPEMDHQIPELRLKNGE